ncbi:MAG: c-type cytochrome biogenesis protein CcsB [Chitinivibrionia bacterium]|nr:c-type cytochrome biogenesis protein CcsB [Chitinivibrionia bacterium]
MQSSDVVFFWYSFWCYLLSFGLFTLYFAFKKRLLGTLGTALLLLGFIPQTIGIILRWKLSGHAPFSNMFEYATVMSWMAVLSFAFLLLRFRKMIIGVFVSFVVLVLIVSASLLPKEMHQQLVPALQSNWLKIHVSLAALGEGAFAIACAVSIMYLLKSAMQRRSRDIRMFPSLELLDDINYKAVSIGYPLFTLGALFAGAIWAYKAWGTFWGWDPKEVGSLIIWLFYTGYLHARLQRNWKGNRAAVLSIAGFVMTMLSFFGNIFLGGQHSYG